MPILGRVRAVTC